MNSNGFDRQGDVRRNLRGLVAHGRGLLRRRPQGGTTLWFTGFFFLPSFAGWPLTTSFDQVQVLETLL